MSKRLVLGATIAVALLALPGAASAAELGVYEHRPAWYETVYYRAAGEEQNVTVDARGESIPALTDHEPGAQRVDVTDTAEANSLPYPLTVPPGCFRLSDQHHGRCVGDPQTQATWRTATPCPDDDPICGGMHPASGLLFDMEVDLPGTTVHYRDTPGGTPISQEIYAASNGATRTIALSAARYVSLDLDGTSSDRVYLHLPHIELSPAWGEWRDRSVSLGAGDDYAYTRDGVLEDIGCGDGTDVVIAGSEDRVFTDCESVSIG